MKVRAYQVDARSTARSRSENNRRVELAEKRVSPCMQQLRKGALGLDRMLVEGGDDEGRRRLVEGALRLAAAATTA